MNILYISKTSLFSTGGGGELRAQEVVKRLREDHSVTVLSAKTDKNLDKWESFEKCDVRHVKTVPDSVLSTKFGFYAPRYMFGIMSIPILFCLCYRRDYDIVLENMTPYPTLSVFLASLFSIPTVAVRHEFDGLDAYENYDPVSATILLILQNILRFGRYAAIITPTRHVANQLAAYGVCENDIHVVPNGINTDPFDKINKTSDDDVIVSVGRLVRQKGFDRLLNAFKHVHDKRPEATLIIAGSGPQRDELETRCQELAVADAVEFRGYVPEEQKNELLARATVFAFASRREGFGLVMLEAMAGGTPIVAWDLPVFHEFFTDRVNGYLVNSQKEMATRLVQILDDPSLQNKFSEANQETASGYSWDRTASETERVLRAVHES